MHSKKSVNIIHTIKRVINLDPLVIVELNLKEAVEHDGISFISSFVFRNLSAGTLSEYRGPRKGTLVSLLEKCVGNYDKAGYKSLDEVSITFGRYGLILHSPIHGKVTVLTPPVFGQVIDSVMVKLDKLLVILHEFMTIKNQWVRHGSYSLGDKYKTPDIDDGEVYFKEITHKTDIEGSLYLLAHPVRYRSGRCRNRIYFHHLADNDLIFIDDIPDQKPLVEKTRRPVAIAFEKFICALEHVNTHEQKNHMIHLFQGQQPQHDLSIMAPYVSLTRRQDHKRLVMNFDQHPASGKVYWFHTGQFTGEVIAAMRDVYNHYL